jgi:hypothetical protein
LNTYCRCAVCQRTNNLELALSDGDYTKGPFFDFNQGEYPFDKICADCLNEVNEQLELFDDDEFNTFE